MWMLLESLPCLTGFGSIMAGQSFEGPGIDEIRRRAMILLGFGLGRSQSRDPRPQAEVTAWICFGRYGEGD